MIRIEQINKSKNLHHLYNLRELRNDYISFLFSIVFELN